MDEYGESKKESKKNGDLEVGFFVFSPKFNLQWTLPYLRIQDEKKMYSCTTCRLY
jgi:hypothetical protein